MTKGQWIEYTGSDEQIAEIRSATNGFIIKAFDYSDESTIFTDPSWRDEDCDIDFSFGEKEVTHYLICNPHQLRDMIKRQADTGQEVWIKVTRDNYYKGQTEPEILVTLTTTPDWNIPNAEYSFTPFEEK